MTLNHLQAVLSWLRRERGYQCSKFPSSADLDHIREGLGEDSWAWQQVTNYVGRVRLYGLDSDLGCQAYMKLIATLVGLGEAMIEVYGDPPEPGVPSGET